jgi:thiol-disulfide isomerase/thioredoxin
MKPVWQMLSALLVLIAALQLAVLEASTNRESERRVLAYVNAHLQPGRPLVVSDLYNKVFTSPEDRQALNKLYNAFFRIPLFVANYQERFGRPPLLKIVAEQFDLDSRYSADILVRVMETDPRVPRFIERDPRTHEIARVDVEQIKNDPQFGQILDRQLGGWEGRAAPEFQLETPEGKAVTSRDLVGKVVLLYVWFTGCPPCMKEAPELAALDRELAGRGLSVVGANADRLLGLGYTDDDRRRYIEKEKMGFPVVHWSKQADRDYGGVSIFPTMFLINRRGVVVAHWIGYTPASELRRAISAGLESGVSNP